MVPTEGPAQEADRSSTRLYGVEVRYKGDFCVIFLPSTSNAWLKCVIYALEV